MVLFSVCKEKIVEKGDKKHNEFGAKTSCLDGADGD